MVGQIVYISIHLPRYWEGGERGEEGISTHQMTLRYDSKRRFLALKGVQPVTSQNQYSPLAVIVTKQIKLLGQQRHVCLFKKLICCQG